MKCVLMDRCKWRLEPLSPIEGVPGEGISGDYTRLLIGAVGERGWWCSCWVMKQLWRAGGEGLMLGGGFMSREKCKRFKTTGKR